MILLNTELTVTFSPPPWQPAQVLGYGIATAAVLRAVMILLGTELVEKFEPVLLVFALILLWSAYSLLFKEDEDEDGDLSGNKVRGFFIFWASACSTGCWDVYSLLFSKDEDEDGDLSNNKVGFIICCLQPAPACSQPLLLACSLGFRRSSLADSDLLI